MGRPPRQALADRLHSVAIHLLRRVRTVDRASLLTGPALSTLSVVVYAGPLSLGDLARAEQVRPPTMTRQIRALERGGLVTVVPDAEDARRRVVTATAAGRRVLAAGRARRVAAMDELLGTLTSGERGTVARALDILQRAVVSRAG